MDCKNFELWHCASGGQIAAYKYHTAEPVDSAYLAAKSISVIMDAVERFGERRKKELNNNQFYKDTIIPETALRYMGVKAGCDGSDLGSGEVSFNYYTDKTKGEIYAEFDELHESLKNIPNVLSVVRIFLVPVFVTVYFLNYPQNIGLAIGVFLGGVDE